MEKLKKLLDRLLFPGAAVVVLSVPVAAALLASIPFWWRGRTARLPTLPMFSPPIR